MEEISVNDFVKMCEEKFENSINEQLSKQKYIFKYNSSRFVFTSKRIDLLQHPS